MKLETSSLSLLVGLPGSGKSRAGVIECIRLARSGRRVYTNLPLRMFAVKAFYGADIPIEVVNEDWVRGLFSSYVARKEWHEDQRKKLMGSYQYRAAEAAFLEANPSALTLPPGSVLIIDEAQYWFPQQDQAKESRDIVKFLSMHRHGRFSCIFITQDPMLVSINVRRLIHNVWHCYKLSQNPGFVYVSRIFRFDLMKIDRWTRECWEAKEQGGEPYDVEWVWPFDRKVFKMYRPYSMVAGVAKKTATVAKEKPGVLAALCAVAGALFLGYLVGTMNAAEVEVAAKYNGEVPMLSGVVGQSVRVDGATSWVVRDGIVYAYKSGWWFGRKVEDGRGPFLPIGQSVTYRPSSSVGGPED